MNGGGRCVVLVLRWVVLPVVSVLPLFALCLSVFALVVCVLRFVRSFVCVFGLGSCLVCLVLLSVVCLSVVVWFLSFLGVFLVVVLWLFLFVRWCSAS